MKNDSQFLSGEPRKKIIQSKIFSESRFDALHVQCISVQNKKYVDLALTQLK